MMFIFGLIVLNFDPDLCILIIFGLKLKTEDNHAIVLDGCVGFAVGFARHSAFNELLTDALPALQHVCYAFGDKDGPNMEYDPKAGCTDVIAINFPRVTNGKKCFTNCCCCAEGRAIA